MWRVSVWLAAGALLAQSPKYGLGRAPAGAELKGVQPAISPEGRNLPPGSGTAERGRSVYEKRCSRCHGPKGEGSDSVALAGGIGSLKTPKPLKTAGSFWPYATTLWDYTHRAMPFNNPGLLTTDQVYAVTAYVLYLNGIVGEKDVMDAKTLPAVKMPNRDGFVPDARPDVGPKPR